MTEDINKIRAAFAKCPNCVSKEMGLRSLRLAKAYSAKNPEMAAAQLENAKYDLAYAEAYAARA